MNKTIENIVNRVSCRSYNDKKVPLGKLNQILEAGKYAPSGMNRQVCNILVVRTKSKVEKTRKALVDMFDRDCLYGANTLAIVYGPRDSAHVIKDGSCILENMFIAATSLKVDSCWINQLDDLLSEPKNQKLRKELGVPDSCVVVGTAIFGYRPEGTELKIKPRKEDFILIK